MTDHPTFNGHGGSLGWMTLAEAKRRYGPHNAWFDDGGGGRGAAAIEVVDGACGCCQSPCSCVKCWEARKASADDASR